METKRVEDRWGLFEESPKESPREKTTPVDKWGLFDTKEAPEKNLETEYYREKLYTQPVAGETPDKYKLSMMDHRYAAGPDSWELQKKLYAERLFPGEDPEIAKDRITMRRVGDHAYPVFLADDGKVYKMAEDNFKTRLSRGAANPSAVIAGSAAPLLFPGIGPGGVALSSMVGALFDKTRNKLKGEPVDLPSDAVDVGSEFATSYIADKAFDWGAAKAAKAGRRLLGGKSGAALSSLSSVDMEEAKELQGLYTQLTGEKLPLSIASGNRDMQLLLNFYKDNPRTAKIVREKIQELKSQSNTAVDNIIAGLGGNNRSLRKLADTFSQNAEDVVSTPRRARTAAVEPLYAKAENDPINIEPWIEQLQALRDKAPKSQQPAFNKIIEDLFKTEKTAVQKRVGDFGDQIVDEEITRVVPRGSVGEYNWSKKAIDKSLESYWNNPDLASVDKETKGKIAGIFKDMQESVRQQSKNYDAALSRYAELSPMVEDAKASPAADLVDIKDPFKTHKRVFDPARSPERTTELYGQIYKKDPDAWDAAIRETINDEIDFAFKNENAMQTFAKRVGSPRFMKHIEAAMPHNPAFVENLKNLNTIFRRLGEVAKEGSMTADKQEAKEMAKARVENTLRGKLANIIGIKLTQPGEYGSKKLLDAAQREDEKVMVEALFSPKAEKTLERLANLPRLSNGKKYARAFAQFLALAGKGYYEADMDTEGQNDRNQ